MRLENLLQLCQQFNAEGFFLRKCIIKTGFLLGFFFLLWWADGLAFIFYGA